MDDSAGAKSQGQIGRLTNRTMSDDYVVGYLFSLDGRSVALMKDIKSQEWGGLRGYMETSENSETSVERICVEKAGLWVENWTMFAQLHGVAQKGNCFKAKTGALENTKQMMLEEIQIFQTDDLPKNLNLEAKWMIPFALDKRLVGIQQLWLG